MSMAASLERDDRWDGLGIDSPGDMESIIGRIKFVPQVSEDVVKRFERVKSVLRFSYFDYDLSDVALDYSLLTLELGIKKRFQEIEGDPEERGLSQLIHWGSRRNLFEPDANRLESLTQLRDVTAHPGRYSLMGYLAYDPIIYIVSLINDMYEDAGLRRERRRIVRNVNRSLHGIVEHGAVMKSADASIGIFLARLLQVENRVHPEIYHFAFWPVFNIPADKAAPINEGKPIVITTTDFKLQDGGARLVVEGVSHAPITVEKFRDASDIGWFDAWLATFEQDVRPEVLTIEGELSRISYLLYTQTLPER